MSWMAVHYECCDAPVGGGDATEANQIQILADIAALKLCADNIEADTQDIQVGVDNLENGLLRPKIC